jgi:integrase/recombinase XerD
VGFRISDAVRLQRSAVDLESGRLLIRVMKTRIPLYSRLPADAIEALRVLPFESQFFLWSGKGQLICAINSAGNTVRAVAKLAGVENAHPHRFRDTFSVRLLENGTDIRTVQLLLGHASVVTTEKHYAPYVAGMQRIVDEAVSSLHFSSDLQSLVDSNRNALRDPKRNTLMLNR